MARKVARRGKPKLTLNYFEQSSNFFSHLLEICKSWDLGSKHSRKQEFWLFPLFVVSVRCSAVTLRALEVELVCGRNEAIEFSPGFSFKFSYEETGENRPQNIEKCFPFSRLIA